MGKFFFICVLISILLGTLSGNLPLVSAAILEESTHAVNLSVKLLGSVCFWSGIMKLCEKSGLTDIICELLKPLLGLVFPKIKKEKAAMGAISMNITANMLGIGNAATPLGIFAMKELYRLSPLSTASLEMVVFVVMNTASLQILPTTVAALRLENGAKSPLDILPAVWLVSGCSLLLGIAAAKLTYRKEGKF